MKNIKRMEEENRQGRRTRSRRASYGHTLPMNRIGIARGEEEDVRRGRKRRRGDSRRTS